MVSKAPIPYMGRGRPRLYPPAMVGDKFGQWTVIAYWLPDVAHGNARRVCVKCACGVWRVHRENLLVSGLSLSCGHANRPWGMRVVVATEQDTHEAKRERLRQLREIRERVDKMEINPFRSSRNRKDPKAA